MNLLIDFMIYVCMKVIRCDDSSLNSILVIVQNILKIIQIVVPILLLVFATIQFIKLVKNPDEKNGVKKMIHSFIAAAIVFFIPMLVNVLMRMMGDGNDISKCWNANVEIGNPSYIESNQEKNRKKFISDASNYEKGSNSASEFCPRSIQRTRSSYHSEVLSPDSSFVINAHTHEFGNWYITQSGVYDCQHIIVGQNLQTKGSSAYNDYSGRLLWFDIHTGEIVASLHIEKEGGHLDRLAYDSDRDVVLVGSGGSEKMLQIDNKTQTIIEEQRYATMTGGTSKFFKYDSYHHQLVGLSGNEISFYQYDERGNTYVKTGGFQIKTTSKWAPQNLNVDGQVIYIANSNPHWSVPDYGVIMYDLKTGEMVEYHDLDPNVSSGGHIEDLIVDMDGNLWFICPAKYWKAKGYVANAFAIGP